MRPKRLVVDTTDIDRRSLETTVDADGRTRVRERYVVVAPVTGRIERIRYAEGAAVRAGDVIARLWPVPLDSETVAQSRARADAAGALALAAEGQLHVARANLEQRKRELTRAVRLSEVGGVAPRVLEECQLALLEAEQSMRAAEERARAAAADGRQARAILDARAAGAASAVLVRAPSAGRVLRIVERSERIVAAGTPLMEVGDPASLEVVIDVLSSDAATIHAGDAVRFVEWGGTGSEGPTVVGRVREIEPAGFTKVSALGVEEQRVNVIADIEALPSTIGDGFRVEARIVVWSAPSVVAVPRSALLQPNTTGASGVSGWSVFIVRDGRVESRAVRIGHLGVASAEVLAGIDVGDEVILFPSDRVTPGVRVSTRKNTRA
jgi:HlyD family secretion protein